ncbi:TetR/AcrR family transcriptional regulator [Actinoplanes sp. NPDC051494]|uniref:TetR/AcrR family transcriptional regulator n=1 Tax=Actinoplanes sp. NPDC051494 TaxID=3363907 RepID=UPI0037A2FCA4
MDITDPLPQKTYSGQPDKRRAISQAARAVFGRAGYSGAGVDTIAAEAGVSKRTVYNHFIDKEQLFLSVILEGSAQVAETHNRIADRHLRKILDLREDLTAFALEWATSPTAFAGHFALVRTIQAEAARLSPAVLEAWQDAGPRAFQRELARHLDAIADRGLLDIDDAATAALHFNLLTFVSVAQHSFHHAITLDEEQVTALVTSGVTAFLRLYQRP